MEQLIVNFKILHISLGMKRTFFPKGFFPQEGASYTTSFLLALSDHVTVGRLGHAGLGFLASLPRSWGHIERMLFADVSASR